MVQTIKRPIEHYECSECGIQYEDKEWAEKCEAWCKEHHSCNLEIISHTLNSSKKEPARAENDLLINNRTFLTRLFYSLVGFSASAALFLAFYWHFRLTSNIASLIGNTYGQPFYFWPYVSLTLVSVVLFGVNAALLVYRWRKFGPSKIKNQTGTAMGSLTGIAAAACPICGSALLTAIGITAGLAAFPFAGLELKLLSVALLAIPIWLTWRDIKKMELACEDGSCPTPQDATLQQKDKPYLQGVAVLTLVLLFVGWNMLKTDPALAGLMSKGTLTNAHQVDITSNSVFNEVVTEVIPEKGFQSKIVLGDSIIKLVQDGVIDAAKFEDIYKDRGGFPPGLKNVLTTLSNKPILLTRENANFYVNLLWPIGLSNYMESNKKSPMINGNNVFNFASTGGWNLGKEKNGGSYFNKLSIISLTPEQEALVIKIAQNSYRPCCNNSTYFQDCNHGSALLGLLELGASQGLSEDRLWKEAVAFNSFWFPQQYIYDGLYLKVVKGIDWDKADPKMIMGKDFSSGSGSGNIQAEVAKISNLIPTQGKGGGAGCGA